MTETKIETETEKLHALARVALDRVTAIEERLAAAKGERDRTYTMKEALAARARAGTGVQGVPAAWLERANGEHAAAAKVVAGLITERSAAREEFVGACLAWWWSVEQAQGSSPVAFAELVGGSVEHAEGCPALFDACLGAFHS